jgi:hypothetical protein
MRVVLTVIAAILWAVGWLTGKTVLAALWIGAALQLGWADAHRRRSAKM